MNKQRLDQELVNRKLVTTRSQAENYIRLGYVEVNGQVITKAGTMVQPDTSVKLTATEQYVSRAALKLASVADSFGLDFRGKVVLDVGSSTGGFTDYALQHGARKVIAVEVGRDQLHSSLRGNSRIELHEQTDIRDLAKPAEPIDITVIDVSFVSLREILPSVNQLAGNATQIVAMCKPQFEAPATVKHKGVIKNEAIRRNLLKDFESWVQNLFVIQAKADSGVAGAKGNQERFYLLKRLKKAASET